MDPSDSTTDLLGHRIMDSLATLLRSQSMADTSVRDMLLAASVARGTFYARFHSKYDVLASAMVRIAADNAHLVMQWADADDSDLVESHRLWRVAISEGVMRSWTEHSAVRRSVHEMRRIDPALNDRIAKIETAIVAVLATKAARVDGRMEASPDDIVRATAVFAMMEEMLYRADAGEFGPDTDLLSTITDLSFTMLFQRPCP